MNRRAFLLAASAATASLFLPLAANAGKPANRPNRFLGVGDWNKEYLQCDLLLNGKVVTGRCGGSNPGEGWCDLYDADANVRFVVPVQKRRHYGRVEIVPKVA